MPLPASSASSYPPRGHICSLTRQACVCVCVLFTQGGHHPDGGVGPHVQYSSMAIVRHGCGFGVLRRHGRLGMQLYRTGPLLSRRIEDC